MPNLVNENKFIRFLSSFSPTMNFILSLLILLSTLFLWVLFFYLPVNLELKKEKFLYNDYLVRKSVYQRVLNNLDSVENENKNLSVKLKKICDNIFTSQEMLDNILSLLKKNELSCSELIPQESKQSDLFNKENYILKAKGKYLNMLSFLADIKECKGSVKVRGVEFIKKKKGKVLLDAKIQLALFKM